MATFLMRTFRALISGTGGASGIAAGFRGGRPRGFFSSTLSAVIAALRTRGFFTGGGLLVLLLALDLE